MPPPPNECMGAGAGGSLLEDFLGMGGGLAAIGEGDGERERGSME